MLLSQDPDSFPLHLAGCGDEGLTAAARRLCTGRELISVAMHARGAAELLRGVALRLAEILPYEAMIAVEIPTRESFPRLLYRAGPVDDELVAQLGSLPPGMAVSTRGGWLAVRPPGAGARVALAARRLGGARLEPDEAREWLFLVAQVAAAGLDRLTELEQQAARQSRFQGVLDSGTHLILQLDPAHHILLINAAACAVFRQPCETLMGQRFDDLLEPAEREKFAYYCDLAKAEGSLLPYELRISAGEGEEHWVEWRTQALRDHTGQLVEFQSIGLDITQRRQRERELETIALVSAALRAAQTSDDMPPVVLDQLMDVLHLDAALLISRDPLAPAPRGVYGRGAWAAVPGQADVVAMLSEAGCQVSQNPQVIGTHAERAQYPAELWQGEVQAAACVSLLVNRRPVGMIWAGKRAPFTTHDTRLLRIVVEMAGNAMERAALHEQTQLRLQRLSTLQAINLAVSASLDLRLTLSILLDQVTLSLGIDAADVLLMEPNLQTLAFSGGAGFFPLPAEAERTRLGEGPAGAAALERRMVSVARGSGSSYEPVLNRFDDRFASYVALPMIAKGQVEGVLELYWRTPVQLDAEWVDFLRSLSANAAVAIDNAGLFDRLQRSNLDLSVAYEATIEGWSRALELRDSDTEGHTRRVADLTERLARQVGAPEEQLVHIRRGALLHDIGKMGVPDAVLQKEGPLSDAEWALMRRHPDYALQMLEHIEYLRPVLDIPYCHHEHWDGTGYPRGLAGEAIPLAARIFAVVDVWDALTTDRPYRKAWPAERALRFLALEAGSHFDPRVVDAFFEMLGEDKPRENR